MTVYSIRIQNVGSGSERLDKATSLTIHVSCAHVATQEKPLNSA